MEKHLRVNTSILDMTATKPETIEQYDEIKINCSLCVTTEKTRQLLSQGKIAINCSNVFEACSDENVRVTSVNGLKTITAEVAVPEEPTVLIVNGALIIEDSDKKNLSQFKDVFVNGGLLHPKGFDVSNISVNGAFIPYPDGAILTFQNLELTDSFIKFAIPGATYFVQGIPSNFNIGSDLGASIPKILKGTGLRALEPIDFQALKSKNIHFYTGWVTTIEENVEELMQIVSGYIGSTIVPAGYKIMKGGKLDMLAIRRFGKCIYVDGDLDIYEEDRDALMAVEKLSVSGNVRIAEGLVDIFFEKCSAYVNLTVYKGELIDIKLSDYTINSELLENMDNSATFSFSDSEIRILPDVSKELLLDKINEIIINDSTLILNLKQNNALRKRITNKASDIIISEYEKKLEPEPEEKDFIETKINCAYYKL